MNDLVLLLAIGAAMIILWVALHFISYSEWLWLVRKFLQPDEIAFARSSRSWSDMRELLRDRYEERKSLLYWRILQYLRQLLDKEPPVNFTGYSVEEVREILWHRDTRVLYLESTGVADFARLSAMVGPRQVDWDFEIPGGLSAELRREVNDLERATKSAEMFGIINE